MSLLTVYFIRHGLTQGNEQARFGGVTEFFLTEEGRQNLKDLKENYGYPEVERVYTSPAIRTRETAFIIYPDHPQIVKKGLWEYHLGEAEGRKVSDYYGTALYDQWCVQAEDFAFPGGETMLEAKLRVQSAMTRIVKECHEDGISTAAVFSHGQILKLLLQDTLISNEPENAFLLCPNGMGLEAKVEYQEWFQERKMRFVRYLPEGAPRLKPEDSPYFVNSER